MSALMQSYSGTLIAIPKHKTSRYKFVALYYPTLLFAAVNLNGEVSELAEGARLEIVYAPKGYPGFKSLPLRHFFQAG